MPLKPAISSKTEIFGLFFRAGARRWFWGWKAPQLIRESSAQTHMTEQPAGGRWSNVAEWLRRMHAEADRSTTGEQKQIDGRKPTYGSQIKLAGFVCFWRMPRKEGESRRQRFFSIYDDLRETVKQNLPSPVTDVGGRRWNLVRVSAPGRWFLGFGRR